MKKNDVFTVTIEDLSVGGEGIGKVDGYALFVKDTLPGDVIKGIVTKVGPRFGYGRLTEILKPSPDRVEPRCPVAGRCGGCTLQHLSYEGQLRYKEKKVRDCLTRIGGVNPAQVEWLPILGMTDEAASLSMKTYYDGAWHYRNKAQFPVRCDLKENPITGFFAGRSHRLIPVSDCDIQHPIINEVVHCVLAFLQEYKIRPYDEEKHTGLVRHIYVRRGYHTGQVMVCLVVNERESAYVLQGKSIELVKRLCEIEGMTSIFLNFNTEQTNVILGSKMSLLWGQPYIEDRIGEIRYRISPQSFYQVNPVQTEKLYATALSFAKLTGNENVWDLYCGIGTISLFLARQAAHVFGVEIVPEAVENAGENAQLNGITNVSFACGAAEEVAADPEKFGFSATAVDVIVVDPPRKGCNAALLDTMVRMAPNRIVYVSCDPATLARDVKLLGEKGYEVRKVRAVDMFPQGGHVETVIMLSHKKPDSVINVKVEFGEGEGKVPLDNIAKRAEAYKPKTRVTYKMIKEYIEAKYGFKVHTAYIAEVKRELGLPMYDAPNAVEELKQPRKHPTAEKVEAIKDALEHFEII